MSRAVVLNTRPVGQQAELSRLLRAAGFESVEAPAIEIVPAWREGDLARTRTNLREGGYAWVVLASQNAGRAIVEDLGQPGPALLAGAATAAALGLTPTLALPRFSAAAALRALAPRVTRGQRVLVPRAAEGRDELIGGLAALAVDVDAPIAYRTQAVDAAAARLRRGGIDVVTLCSPSAVSFLARERGLLDGVVCVCLGETTAAAARAAGVRVANVARETSMAGLVRAIGDALEVAA